MRKHFAAVAAFASEVTVREGETERRARAFIQPLSITSPDYESRATAMGLVDDRRYLLIAEPDALSGDGEAEISCGGKKYELLRCEMMGGGSHWEGLLRLKGGGENVQ